MGKFEAHATVNPFKINFLARCCFVNREYSIIENLLSEYFNFVIIFMIKFPVIYSGNINIAL